MTGSSRRARDRAHLIRLDDDALVSSEVGIMHPATVKLGYFLLLFLFFALLGVLVWAAVVFADEKPYYAPNAVTEVVGDYTLYYDRAAEPFSGAPARVMTGVTEAGTCTASCDADADCRFFTYDQPNGRCYVYSGGVLSPPLATAAVPGPTELDATVYVKTGDSHVAQLRGTLRNGNQTLF